MGVNPGPQKLWLQWLIRLGLGDTPHRTLFRVIREATDDETRQCLLYLVRTRHSYLLNQP